MQKNSVAQEIRGWLSESEYLQGRADAAVAPTELGAGADKAVSMEEGDELLPGMAFMMTRYEDELKKPIRNIVNGQLLRTILIQVQLPGRSQRL